MNLHKKIRYYQLTYIAEFTNNLKYNKNNLPMIAN